MRMRTPLLAGALCLVTATPAFACNFYFASTFMRIPARPSFGVGVEANFDDPATFAISGDVAMRLGNNMVVQPGIGVCTGDDNTDPFFGAGVAYRLTSSGTTMFNLQSGISYQSFDGGSQMIIPVGAAASFASLWFWTLDIDALDESVSETDPVLFGGITSKSGSMGWTLGAQLYMGEETDFAVVAGLSFNQAASAIQNIPKLFRR
jgi:hypothetical protein